ncbi:hypothetical protein RBU49_07960 [Clostridium sp. MB40-C1]|uniref:hypothetical protein n=1 Tax=Clostridium sp. MB40-C1 TaxID=3070996 RepID=UPI0027E216C3|nr:hypothetical protein [Clostridium sp. MB40-C1]WMJ82175.1 hypothetical protein RBU49_07960 [Clostridium sp. MB40-C1]
MTQIVLQYVLVVLLVIGLAYFVYLIRDKGLNISEDYFGIARTLLDFLGSSDNIAANGKNVLRAISESVNYVEVNYRDEDNRIKEEKAVILAKEAIDALNFENNVPEENLRQLIRLCAVFMPPTNKQDS